MGVGGRRLPLRDAPRRVELEVAGVRCVEADPRPGQHRVEIDPGALFLFVQDDRAAPLRLQVHERAAGPDDFEVSRPDLADRPRAEEIRDHQLLAGVDMQHDAP